MNTLQTGARRPGLAWPWICALWLSVGLPGGARAGESAGQDAVPLWEFGLFNTASRIPDYRGSDEYTTYLIPFPYFIYRGDILRINRSGVKAVFLQTERLQSDVSLSGNPPVRHNEARGGMPDLDAIGELGPALRVLFAPRGSPRMLYLETSVRGAFSGDWEDGPTVGYEGLSGGIRLTYFSRLTPGESSWGHGLSLGADFADSSYNNYFYGVDDDYARPDRPAYRSPGGYAGAWLSAYVVRRFTRNLSFATFVRWDHLDGAAFEDSPLVRDRDNLIVACALTWTLAESTLSVTSDEPEDE